MRVLIRKYFTKLFFSRTKSPHFAGILRIAKSLIIFAGTNFREIVKSSQNSGKLIPAKINSLKVAFREADAKT